MSAVQVLLPVRKISCSCLCGTSTLVCTGGLYTFADSAITSSNISLVSTPSNRYNRQYLSDAAFEYAFSSEDLVSDLLQLHVDARLPYSTRSLLRCDHKYAARRQQRPAGRGESNRSLAGPRGEAPRSVLALPRRDLPCRAAGVYRFPDVCAE